MARKRLPPQPKTEFAARLIKVREAFGMATKRPNLDKGDFAELLGLEEQTYRRYERGDTEPNLETLRKIRRLTNVSLDMLICGDEAKISTPKIVSHPKRTGTHD